MKKTYFFIFSFIILEAVFFPTVFARPADPERFPQYEPLHSNIPGIVPNYKGNVEFSSEPPQEESSENSQNAGSNSEASGSQNQGSGAEGGDSIVQKSGLNRGLIVLFALGAIILGYALWSRKSSQTP